MYRKTRFGVDSDHGTQAARQPAQPPPRRRHWTQGPAPAGAGCDDAAAPRPVSRGAVATDTRPTRVLQALMFMLGTLQSQLRTLLRRARETGVPHETVIDLVRAELAQAFPHADIDVKLLSVRDRYRGRATVTMRTVKTTLHLSEHTSQARPPLDDLEF